MALGYDVLYFVLYLGSWKVGRLSFESINILSTATQFLSGDLLGYKLTAVLSFLKSEALARADDRAGWAGRAGGPG